MKRKWAVYGAVGLLVAAALLLTVLEVPLLSPVGMPEEGSGVAEPTQKLNLNTADVGEIERVIGIGREQAMEIVQYREQNGGFFSVQELMLLPAMQEVPQELLEIYFTVS